MRRCRPALQSLLGADQGSMNIHTGSQIMPMTPDLRYLILDTAVVFLVSNIAALGGEGEGAFIAFQ